MEQPLPVVLDHAAVPPKHAAPREANTHAYVRRPGGVTSESSDTPDGLAADQARDRLADQSAVSAPPPAPTATAELGHASSFMPRNTLSLTPGELDQLTHVLTDSSRVKQELKEAEAMVEQMRRKIRELETNLARAHENVTGSSASGDNNGSVGTGSGSRDGSETTDLSPALRVAASTVDGSGMSMGAGAAPGAPGGSAGSADSRSREGTSSVSQPGGSSGSGSGGDTTSGAAAVAAQPMSARGQHASSAQRVHAHAVSAGAAPVHGQQVIQPPAHVWMPATMGIPAEWSAMPQPMDMSSNSMAHAHGGSAGVAGFHFPAHAYSFAPAAAVTSQAAAGMYDPRTMYMYSDAAGRAPSAAASSAAAYDYYQRHMAPWAHNIHAMSGAQRVAATGSFAAAGGGFESGSKSDGQSSVDSDKQLAAYRVTVTAPSAALRAVDTRDIGPNGTSLAGHKRGRGGDDHAVLSDGHHSPHSNTSDSAGDGSGPTDASSGGADSGGNGSTSTSLLPASDASAGDANARTSSSSGNGDPGVTHHSAGTGPASSDGSGVRTPPEADERVADLRLHVAGRAGPSVAQADSPDMDVTEEAASQEAGTRAGQRRNRRDAAQSPSIGPAAARAPLIAVLRQSDSSTSNTMRVHIRCSSLDIHPMHADAALALHQPAPSNVDTTTLGRGGVVVREIFLSDGRRLLYDRDSGALYSRGQRLSSQEVSLLEEINLLPPWLLHELRAHAAASVANTAPPARQMHVSHETSSVASSGPSWLPRQPLDVQPRTSHITADVIADAAAASAAAAMAAGWMPPVAVSSAMHSYVTAFDPLWSAASMQQASSEPGLSQPAVRGAAASAANHSDEDFDINEEEHARAPSSGRERSTRRKRPTVAAVEGIESAASPEPRSREASISAAANEDGTVSGKLIAWEKVRMEEVLDSIRMRKLQVARGELAHTLQQHVNPARRRAFYEKYISRHKLNQTLTDLLGPPRPRTAAHQMMQESERLNIAALKRAGAQAGPAPAPVAVSSQCEPARASTGWQPIASDVPSNTVVLGRMLNSLAGMHAMPATSHAARFASFGAPPYAPMAQLPSDFRPQQAAYIMPPQMPNGLYGVPASNVPVLSQPSIMNTAFRMGTTGLPVGASTSMPTSLAFAAPLGAPAFDSFKGVPSPPSMVPYPAHHALPSNVAHWPTLDVPTMNPWMLSAIHDAVAASRGMPTSVSLVDRASVVTRRLAGLDTDVDMARDVTSAPPPLPQHGTHVDGSPPPFVHGASQDAAL